MTTTLPATQDEGATIGVELYGDEHQTWLGRHPIAPYRQPGEPTIVRRRAGQIAAVFPAAGSVEELDVIAAGLAPTWTCRHIPAVVGKIWACPEQGCGYHIADGPAPDDELSTLELIREHLEQHERDRAPGPYAGVAAELRRIADDLATITGDQSVLGVRLTVYVPYGLRNASDARTADLVDPVALALTGESGQAERAGAGWHHQASCDRGPVNVWVYGTIADPTVREQDAELERLRAENDALRLAAGQSGPKAVSAAATSVDPADPIGSASGVASSGDAAGSVSQ